MKNPSLTKFFLTGILLALVGLFYFISCGKDSDKITNGGTEPAKIESGKWTATAGFGTFDFTVNSESTHITEFSLNFDGWTIGNTTHNGTITISRDPGWQISDRQFSFSRDLNPFPTSSQTMTIDGTFDDNGREASGDWEADFDGSTDSGTWEASF